MLKRLVRMISVTTWNATSGANFQRSTVIYGDNGRGKTSLAAVLRSLASNEPTHILERSAIAATTPPHVQLLFETGGKNDTYEFKNGAWSGTKPDIEIFDTRFVSDNVYSGDVIDPEQRRQLYHFVLGAANVSLAEKVDELDREVRDANVECAELQSRIEESVGKSLSIDELLKLPALADTTNAIPIQEASVRAAEQSSEIGLTPAFDELPVPTVDVQALRDCMARSLSDIAVSAELHVQRHLQERLGEGAREWVEDGLRYLGGNDDCPFCGLQVSASALISDYRIAFSDAYKQESEDNATTATAFDSAMSSTIESACLAAIKANNSIVPFWRGHQIDVDGVTAILTMSDWATIRVAVERLFDRRRQSLLTAVEFEPGDEVILEKVPNLVAVLAAYNEAVASANGQITSLKATAAKSSLADERARLARMRLQALRRSPEVDALCTTLERLRSKKKAAEKAKEMAKKELDDSSIALFTKYQDRINKHLANCACGYSISGTKTSFAGGKPRTEYQLKINGKSFDLIAPKGATHSPCFRNTLSDGDRNALALAFFLARLDLDPDLEKKIVIVDDPMTSLDAHRRTYTCEQIAQLSSRARQVVVLTHDSIFAADVWDRLGTPKTALKIVANGSLSEIVEWDIDEETASDYFRRCRTLLRCVNGEKGLDVTAAASAIRLVLEGNLRMRFPADLPVGKWLGSLIEAIRDAPEGSSLEGAKRHVSELTALNEYSKKHHHDGTPSVVMPVPAFAELQSYCRRTLEFIRGV